MRIRACLLSIVLACLPAASGCYLFHRAPGEAGATSSDPALDAGATPVDAAASAADGCEVRTLRTGQRYAPIDMVWVVDSSRSMTDEQARIRQTINTFVSDAEARSYDVHLVMVTESNIVPAPLGEDERRYRFVARPVSSNEPLQALLAEWPAYRDFLRPEAALHFVVVTDDDSALPAAEFAREMDRLAGRRYVVHAVASPDVAGQPCSTVGSQACMEGGRRAAQLCGAAAIGREYYALADALGGERISICLDDWGEVFGPLLEAVTPTAIPCAIELASNAVFDATEVSLRYAAATLVLVPVPNEAACGRARGYYYVTNERTAQLTLCPVACAATRLEGVELRVALRCE